MPITPNPNKFRITSNNPDYTGAYYSTSGSGIDLHSPISMEMSYQLVQISSYSPIENDFVIVCDTVTAGSNIDIDLTTLSSTCRNGKTLIIKKLTDGNSYNVNITGTTIDGNGSYSWNTDYYSIMIVFDKISNTWSIVNNNGVQQIIAGSNITISPTSGTGSVTISSTGGGSVSRGFVIAMATAL